MEHINRDVDDLAALGYKQELTRSLGSFSSFAAGFSYLSIMSGMFQLFAFGFGFAGPLVWWAWIAVFAGMMLVALCFAETSAQFPIAGSVYSWASRQGSEAWGWMTGWIMLIASIATVAGVAVAWQISLPAISRHLQVLEDAALIARAIDGRVHRCSIEARPLRDSAQWLEAYRAFWDETLGALAAYVDKEPTRNPDDDD